jgi:hypothetical protein
LVCVGTEHSEERGTNRETQRKQRLFIISALTSF